MVFTEVNTQPNKALQPMPLRGLKVSRMVGVLKEYQS